MQKLPIRGSRIDPLKSALGILMLGLSSCPSQAVAKPNLFDSREYVVRNAIATRSIDDLKNANTYISNNLGTHSKPKCFTKYIE